MNHLRIIVALGVCALPLLFASRPAYVAVAQDAVTAGTIPAFLDSPTQIRLWLEKPLPPDALLPGRFLIRVEGRSITVAAVSGGGDAERERTLPRTPGRVVLAGTLQATLGGQEWDPDGEVTQMTEEQPGVFALVVALPRGRYEFKVTRNGSWQENYGVDFTRNGSNIAVTVPADNIIVRFVVDFNQRTIRNSLTNPTAVSAPSTVPPRPLPPKPNRFPVAVLTLAQPIRPEMVDDLITVRDDTGKTRRVIAREILSEPEFRYNGADLGSRWGRAQTTFKVWSPVSRSASVLLFDRAIGGTPRVVPMTRSSQGVWAATIRGNLHGVFYQYRFESYGEIRETPDLNCFAASPDSRRSLVVDLSHTNPPGWPVPPPRRHTSLTDAVLYELHVRDFTIRPESGVSPEKRGKYAGLAQPGTRVPGTDFKTGMDYLKDLGVTDIHLLPTQNFLMGNRQNYSWGYVTNLFNVPEESYSVTPNDPVGVIREFKGMVAALHRSGLRVVMDVVYNHTWPPDGKYSPFWQTVPYYYVRTNDRGDLLNESGVGNALHDERPMVRKFVRDSLLYWMTEYGVDGFRFDLLGMHHPESVRDWAAALRARRPDVTLYGEPWTGGGPIRFGKGDQRGSGVAVFNDRFRNAFRGDLDGTTPGFAMGGGGDIASLHKAFLGWIDSAPNVRDGFTNSPAESINYVSAHDNLTLWDRVARSLPANQPELALTSVRLMAAATLLAEGVPFLEGGVEIGRTKNGNANSYDAGDGANSYDWQRATRYVSLRDYYRGLIRLRLAHPAFRLRTADAVRRSLHFLPSASLPEKTVAYTLESTTSSANTHYLVIFHGSRVAHPLALPAGNWRLLADGERAGAQPFATVRQQLALRPLSAYVLQREGTR